jgi:hypothetical protein
MIWARPVMSAPRLRQCESALEASATRPGSRLFQASSAACTFCRAVSAVNGGSGGRPVIFGPFAGSPAKPGPH